MWVVGLSFLLMGRRSILAGQVEHLHHSPAHRSHLFADVFADATVGDLIEHMPPWTPVTEHTPLQQLRALLLDQGHAVLPVIDGAGRLSGLVTQEDVRALGADPVLEQLLLARDIASGAAAALQASDQLARAMRRLTEQRTDALPVVDGERRPIAVITRRVLLDHYQRSLERARAEQRSDTVDPAQPAAPVDAGEAG